MSTIWKVLAVIVFICILLNIHHIFSAKCSFSPESQVLFCGVGSRRRSLEVGLLLMELLFSSIVPSLCIIYLNSRTIDTIRKYRKKMIMMLQSSNRSSSSSSYSSRDQEKKYGMTIMLIVISFTFVHQNISLSSTSQVFMLKTGRISSSYDIYSGTFDNNAMNSGTFKNTSSCTNRGDSITSILTDGSFISNGSFMEQQTSTF